MKLRQVLGTLAVFGFLSVILVGCGGSPEGDMPAAKAESKEEQDKKAAALLEGMKGQYKGAPGVAPPPGGGSAKK